MTSFGRCAQTIIVLAVEFGLEFSPINCELIIETILFTEFAGLKEFRSLNESV